MEISCCPVKLRIMQQTAPWKVVVKSEILADMDQTSDG